MNLFQAIGSGFRNYGNFHGRALRSEYWYWALFAGVVSNIAPFFDPAFFPDRSVIPLEIVGRQFGPIYLLTALALILPGVAVSARRLHDLDRTAWWLLLWFTGIGGFVLLYWFCKRGTVGPNRFGPVPLGWVDPKIVSFDSFSGPSSDTGAVADPIIPPDEPATRSVPLWLKAPLIVVAVFVLLTGGAALGIYVWWQNHGAALTSAVGEGAQFGADKDRQACVNEAVARIRRGGGMTEVVKDRLFLDECLKAARPVAGFCDNVPAKSETAASANWQRLINQKYQLKGTFDELLLSEIQTACDADKQRGGATSAQTQPPQCPSDTNVPWTNCQGTRAIPGAGEYAGEFRDDKMNGRGTLTYPSGEQHAGGFKDGKFDGQGAHTWPDGRKFVGEYRNGKAEGPGEFTSPSGQRYVGNYRNDRRNGQGELTLASGERYVGEFKDGNFDGHGTYTWPNGRKFVGEYRNGKAEGPGEFTSPGGQRYVGNYKGDKRNGQGELTLANGERYVGEFKDGNFDGQGTYAWPDGRKYEGQYKDGKRSGQGVLTSADGGKYAGGFRDGSYDGAGEMISFNGQQYVGEFKGGKFEGQGTYTWPSGQKYVGEYRNGRFEGQGTLIWPSGQKYVGEFSDGKRHGNGKMFAADGSETQSGIWENDTFLK